MINFAPTTKNIKWLQSGKFLTPIRQLQLVYAIVV